MTYAYWYLFAAFLLPYCFTVIAKINHPQYSNRAPRLFLANLTGWRQRAHWVQLNAFETFAPFASAVIIAHQFQASQPSIDILSLAFIIFRVLYGVFYVLDRPSMRSLAWFGGFCATIGLFILAAQ
jgi:uncharacterized MAPEG superfamily protein